MENLAVSPQHNQLLNSKVVPMYFKELENTTQIKALNFSLTEALL